MATGAPYALKRERLLVALTALMRPRDACLLILLVFDAESRKTHSDTVADESNTTYDIILA